MTVGTTCHHGSFFRGRGTWSNRSGCEMPKVEILPRNLGEGLDKMDDLGKCSKHLLRLYFPTCQVRVVRFYQSCSPPPRLAVLLCPPPRPPPPPPPPVSPRPCLHQLPPSLPPCQLCAKLFANSLRQALCQLPSSVCTAGPQPGTCPAQCAPLDLNLGPSQLSVHRWTSTWDLPSSVCTAGPQPGTFPAQCAPLDLNLGLAQLSVHRWTSTAR